MARQLTTPFLSVTHFPAITFSAEPALPVNLGCRRIRKPHLSRPFQIRLTPRGLSCLKNNPGFRVGYRLWPSENTVSLVPLTP